MKTNIKKYDTFINENSSYDNFFVTYNIDKYVCHVTSKKRKESILKDGFKTGHETGLAEKRKAIYFSDIDVNYGIYARNQEGESNFGDEVAELCINIKGLKLLNLTYKDENGEFVNHKKYKSFNNRGELEKIPYDIDGTISYLKDGRVYEVSLFKEVANKLL